MRDLDRLIQILESANGAVVSEAFAADCRQAAAWMRRAHNALAALDRDARPVNWDEDDEDFPDNAEAFVGAWGMLDAALGREPGHG